MEGKREAGRLCRERGEERKTKVGREERRTKVEGEDRRTRVWRWRGEIRTGGRKQRGGEIHGGRERKLQEGKSIYNVNIIL